MRSQASWRRRSPERYDLKGRVAVVMVDLGALLDAPRRSWEAQAGQPVFPAVDLDMAFLCRRRHPRGGC